MTASHNSGVTTNNAQQLSDQKQMVQALKDKIRLQQTIIDSLPAFVGMFSLEGILLEANQASHPLADLSHVGEYFPNSYCWSFSPDVQNKLRDAFTRAADGEAVRYNTSIRVKDEAFVSVNFMLAPVRDEHEQVTQIIGFGIDSSSQSGQSDKPLTETSRLLDGIVENVPNMIFLKRASDLRFEFMNRAGEELLGLDRKDLYGHNDADFFPKEQADFFIARDREALQQQGVMDIPEETIATPRGDRVLHTKKIAIRDELGAPLYLLGISEDITDLKLVERNLRRFKNTLDQTLDCVFIFDADSLLFTYINEGAVRQVGYSRDELLQMHPFDIKPNFSEKQFRKMLTPLLAGELVSHNFETIHQHKNGQHLPVEILLQYIEQQNERAHFVAIVRDLTERKQSEQERLTQAMIIDQIHDSVISTDLDGVITSWNKGAERLFAYSSEQMCGKHVASLYPNEEHTFLKNELIPALQKNGAHEVEVKLQRKSGEKFFAHQSLSMLYDQQGNASGMIGYCIDISRRKRMEAELERYRGFLETQVEQRTTDLVAARDDAERANSAKSDFLSQMSHELRTPMNAILGFGQLLKLDSDDMDQLQKDNIDEILNAGHHLLNLINEVLDLAKIESGKMTISMQTVPVNELLNQSISLIRGQANDHQLKIINNLSDKSYYVQADANRLKQVLINLLSNSVKYNRAHGSIILDAVIINKKLLRINITDSGVGLSDEEIAKLFLPFNRLDRTNNIEGTGIGLVITKHLIELMGGSIGIESTTNVGSTFWIELALTDES